MYSIYTSEKKGLCRTSNQKGCSRKRLQEIETAAGKMQDGKVAGKCPAAG
jgi:hypothetical protein